MREWDTVGHGRICIVANTLQTASGKQVDMVYRSQHDGLWHAHVWKDGGVPLHVVHRVGGPAMYFSNPSGPDVDIGEIWKRQGEGPSRIDGPARNTPTWFYQGVYHRIEGPAEALYGTWGQWHVENIDIEPRGWQRRARRMRWLRN